jgi:hypothetical protein
MVSVASSAVSSSVNYLRQLLALSSAPGEAQKAFERLCAAGCEPEALATRLLYVWWASGQPFNMAVNARAHAPMSEYLSGLDSWDKALNKLSLRQLDKVSKSATKLKQLMTELQSDLTKIKATPLVRHLVRVGEIKEGDLLNGSVLFLRTPDPKFDEWMSSLDGLISLPGLARKYGPLRKKPNLDQRLEELLTYVRSGTGSANDSSVVKLLAALFPDGGVPIDMDSLKQWRYARGLRRKTRARSGRPKKRK